MRLSAKHRGSWHAFREIDLESTAETLFWRGSLVEVVRAGQGDPIVVVPGLAGGWKLVAPLARTLARRHEVVVLGLRGDQRAVGSPSANRVGDYAEDLAGLIRHLGLERPTVFGVSFGGAVALELAIGWPGLVGGLIVTGAEARFHVGLGATVARRVLERFPLPADNRFVNQFFNLLHGGKPDPGPLAEFVVQRCWETDQAVIAARLRALEGFDVADRLWRIDAPTLVLAGSRDVIVPPTRQRALAAAIPGARFAGLEGAGHIGFLTHRDEIARHVRRLVRDARALAS